MAISTLSCSAQLDIPKPERLTHVEGIVVDPAGHPAADLSVKLLRDDKSVAETRTDTAGEFEFEHVPSGQYTFRIDRSHFAPAARDIVVTDEIVTHLERKKLYVILGPGACQDECSAVLTSKRDFDRTIRKNNRH
ncbi:carboxypeptidase-like regulatory domain-containing protein [Occallatibacter savannae]|uniref:carboxypeptidase-like regulatory domain-containing protein n=1 Tax=Occallatibacter savannae TaxID=1002691 RepID=UPI0013A53BC7|nr:carboxypeptidase-like regulatory domain-containing protein [Occallatibacter savannae]